VLPPSLVFFCRTFVPPADTPLLVPAPPRSSCSARMRRGGSRRISPSCRSFCVRTISDPISPVTKKPLENHASAMLPFSGLFLLLHSVSARDAEIKMVTAAELRAWAEESLEWAQIATNESSRQTFIRWAEIWLELASRGERLTALIEDRSKDRKRRRSSERPRFDQLAFDFAKI
jgi:hypothetical protein